ncbi:hypothetical protein R6Q59_036161 [Mikania micrantha]
MPLGHALVAPRPQLDPNNPNPNQFLTFSNWYPQPPFFNQNSPAGDNVSENQPDPDVDVVPETQPDAQPASSRCRHRRKEVPEKTTKPTITRWSEYEETRETPVFLAMGRGSYRTNDMISGKWRDLQRKVAKFNDIWVKHQNNRKSGENDESVMNEALMTYERENGPFGHIAPWQVMRKSIKWHPVPKLQTSKRTKTSSSGKYMTTQSDSTGRCFVNLNDNKGKRPQASSSTDYKDTLETISDSLQKFVNIHEQKQYNNDMKLLWTPIDHLTGRAREIAEKMKERIMKEYNMD